MNNTDIYIKAQKFLESLEWDDIPDSDGPLATICEALQEIQQYREMEDNLNGISIKQVVYAFINAVKGETQEGYERGRILTNEDADLWRMLKKEEENGMLIHLPCAPGTTVYEVSNNADACYECDDFEKGYCCEDCCGNKQVVDEDGDGYPMSPQFSDYPLCEKQFFEVITYVMKDVDMIYRNMDKFGKTIFLSEEQAQERLKEVKKQK